MADLWHKKRPTDFSDMWLGKESKMLSTLTDPTGLSSPNQPFCIPHLLNKFLPLILFIFINPLYNYLLFRVNMLISISQLLFLLSFPSAIFYLSSGPNLHQAQSYSLFTTNETTPHSSDQKWSLPPLTPLYLLLYVFLEALYLIFYVCSKFCYISLSNTVPSIMSYIQSSKSTWEKKKKAHEKNSVLLKDPTSINKCNGWLFYSLLGNIKVI